MGEPQNPWAGTTALSLVTRIGLDQWMGDLEAAREVPVDLHKQLVDKQRALKDLRHGELLAAQDHLKGQEAATYITAAGLVDDKGKTVYGNEDSRKKGAILLQGTDLDYKAALNRVRAAESRAADLELDIQEITKKLEAHGNLTWTLRDLIRGAVAALNTIATFDGPKFPTEIQLKAPDSFPTVALQAPDSFPAVPLKAPDAMPSIDLTPAKEAA